MAFSLRPYQQKALNDLRTVTTSGAKSPLLVMPTGSGKTALGIAIASGASERGRKTVWLAHREELCVQTLETAARYGVLAGGVGATLSRFENRAAPLQVCMVQTLMARDLTVPADICIVDEAHRFMADEFRKVCEPYALRIGLTATPVRGDGRPLGDIFDSLVVGPSMSDLIALGHLVPCEIVAPAAPLRAGQIAESPYKAWIRHSNGRKTLVFATTVKVAEDYCDEFVANGVPAAVVSANSPNRRQTLADLASGKLRVIVNVGVLTEGFDDPSVECVVLARGFGHVGLYLQVVGRVLRPHPGKTGALVIDLRGSVHEHGQPAEDRTYSLTGEAISVPKAGPRHCPVCTKPLGVSDRACSCGWTVEETEAPKVVSTPLVKFAAKRRETDDQRAASLARWLNEARVKGHKDGAAYYKYQAVYGSWPSTAVKMKAKEYRQ